MEGGITDAERSTMLRAAVSRVGRDELKGALDRSSFPHAQIPKAVVNAINALRKHRDPAAVVGSTQYRAALPYVAAAVADPCLSGPSRYWVSIRTTRPGASCRPPWPLWATSFPMPWWR